VVALVSSDRLAGLLEAQYLGRGLLFGTVLRADSQITFESTLSGDFPGRPSAVVHFYRLPQVPRP
jgi:hypothetical protein